MVAMKNLHDVPDSRDRITRQTLADAFERMRDWQPYQRRWANDYFFRDYARFDQGVMRDLYVAAAEVAMMRDRGARDRVRLAVTRDELDAVYRGTRTFRRETPLRLYGVELVVDDARY